ncbi:hypothetical protein AB9K26_13630 [Psychroserpens sp. XS_ASV72]|uniref:hypothetical protein n=1 Tax=Psychroserpens sp. XS_ASV72 TaxID=3241293 RepID=UPI003512D5D2
MMKFLSNNLYLSFTVICAFIGFNGFSQEKTFESEVISPFNEYTKIPREVAYAHINKSIFIKGETLGFSVYVLDKGNKTPSTITRNIYCTVNDKNDRSIKQALFKVENGVAKGQFFIDSLFTSGKYTFKAYTNWMRNFNEQNHYVQTIEVIDIESNDSDPENADSIKIDAQFLPEGGHLISNTENSIGVIIKNSSGLGVPEVEGNVVNSNGVTLTSFKTNAFGLAKFSLNPSSGERYFVKHLIKSDTLVKPLGVIQSKGIALKLTDLNSKIALAFNTNKETLPELKGRPFTIAIHNGKAIKAVDLVFDDKTQVIKLIDTADLFTGMNVITLFNESHQPVLERLFFNYDGLNLLKSSNANVQTDMDSLKISLPIQQVDTTRFNSFSISILPSGSKSYNPQHNIISSTFLKPYVKGIVENPSYYFTNLSRKTKYELDMVLLTQGWSSYDWNYVRNNVPKRLFDFETGITIDATVNKKETGQYLIYPTRESKSNLLALEDDKTTFTRTEFFPYGTDKLKIGEILKNGKVGKPGLYLSFNPSRIPNYNTSDQLWGFSNKKLLNFENAETMLPAWDKIEKLDEVVISTNKVSTRMEKIKSNTNGNVDIFDDTKRQQYFDIASYLSSRGFRVNNTGGSLSIINTSSPTPNNRIPLVYLDDMLLFDFSILFNFQMHNVDYIVIDRNGFGEGVRGSAGVIKIYTDPSLSLYKQYGTNYQEFEIPLSFSPKKRFYTPIYSSYSSAFFQEYGVVGWVSDVSADANGHLNFHIQNLPLEFVNLYIEGFTETGQFISEVKTIKLN